MKITFDTVELVCGYYAEGNDPFTSSFTVTFNIEETTGFVRSVFVDDNFPPSMYMTKFNIEIFLRLHEIVKSMTAAGFKDGE